MKRRGPSHTHTPGQAGSAWPQVWGLGPWKEVGRKGERRRWIYYTSAWLEPSEDFRPKSFGLEILSSQPKCTGNLPEGPALLCRDYKKVSDEVPAI